MRIDTATGEKVVYLGKNGYDSDREMAEKRGIVKGMVLTVSSMSVGRSLSYAMFDEVDGRFNSVMFDNYDDQGTKRDWYGESYIYF